MPANVCLLRMSNEYLTELSLYAWSVGLGFNVKAQEI